MISLKEESWRQRQTEHQRRVDEWIRPHLARRRAGVSHPVEDFLFDYYSYRPSLLRRWHPGAGITLTGQRAEQFLKFRYYRRTPAGVTLHTAELREERASLLRWAHELLSAVANRPPQFGCFGMHEWAMVYRQDSTETRHQRWPLRHPPTTIEQIVKERGLRCTHFDAFRFFTSAAKPLNSEQLSRETQVHKDQPGCLHANMDLYKISYKLSPLLPSELLADCFELTRELRTLDMRASPYDLSALGYPAIEVESSAGRAEYVALQRTFAERGAALRARLLESVHALEVPVSQSVTHGNDVT